MLYACVALITMSPILFYGYTVILLVYTILDFRLGLSVWIVIALLTGTLEEGNLALIYSPIIVGIYYLKVLNRTEKLYKSNFKFYVFALTFLCFISSLITGYLDYFHVLAVYILIFLASNIIAQQIIKNEENIFLIGNAFIASALIATVSSFFTSDDYSRLGLADSVRQLSNLIGTGLVLLVTLYFVKCKPYNDKINVNQYKFINRVKWGLIVALIAGLVTTVSRGSILATSLSVGVLLLLSFVESLRRLKVKSLVKGGVILVTFATLTFAYGVRILESLNFRTEVLLRRFDTEEMEGGTGIRERIWEAGISGLEGSKIIYGHGVSSFRMLASKKGYDFYAHSVFVDTLVTTGLLGLSVLLLLLLSLFFKGVKYWDLVVIPILVFVVFNYITHGTMKSDGFWYLLAICAGLIGRRELVERRQGSSRR